MRSYAVPGWDGTTSQTSAARLPDPHGRSALRALGTLPAAQFPSEQPARSIVRDDGSRDRSVFRGGDSDDPASGCARLTRLESPTSTGQETSSGGTEPRATLGPTRSGSSYAVGSSIARDRSGTTTDRDSMPDSARR